MTFKKNNISLYIITGLLTLFSCNSDWTVSQKTNYIENCLTINGVTKEQCECAFNIFSMEYSYYDFNPKDQDLNKNNYSNQDKKRVEIINEEIRKCFVKL